MQIKYVLAALEVLLLLSFLAAFPVFNLGNITGIAVSLLLLGATLRFDSCCSFVKKLGLPGKILLGAGALAVVCFIVGAAVFSVKMVRAMNREPQRGDVVVVLGCQVKGERPSRMLRQRLDIAKEYLDETPDAIVIVYGGKGADEKISEAECMRRYLVEEGIDESRIIMEDKSTSTDENLKYSFEIIDSMGLEGNIVLVTDGYHQYRAQLIAKRHGAERVDALSASTELRFIPTYWVREWFGLVQQLFLK